MRDRRFHDGIRDLAVEPAIHVRPVVGMQQVVPIEPVRVGEFLLPHMGPGACAVSPVDAAQPPGADAADVARHRPGAQPFD